MCKKCICFLRVSTQHQDLEGQREKVVNAAIADGYREDEIAVVEGKESAIKLREEERETLNEMKELIQQHPTIESVYVFAIDRLARKVSVILSVKDYLVSNGVNLVFLNPQKMQTMEKKNGRMVESQLTKMLLMFLAYGAEMEMELKQARMQTAKDRMLAAGLVAYSKPLFGYYKKVNKTVEIDENEAKAVRYIFDEYANTDKTLNQIYKELVAMGYFQPKKVQVAATKIRNIIINKAYSGDYSNTDTKKAILYKAIVTKELQEKAIAKCEQNKLAAKKEHKNIYYGKGILKCNGYVMSARRQSASYVDSITNKSISVNVVDSIIWKEACEIYSQESTFRQKTNKEEYINQIDENIAKIENIKTLISQLEKKESKAFDKYLDGSISEEMFDKRIADIKKESKNWSDEIARLSSQNKRYEALIAENENLVRLAPSRVNEFENDAERKNLIDSVIKEVIAKRADTGEWLIRVIAKNDLLENWREAHPEFYIYSARGRAKQLTFVDGNGHKEDISNTIVTRFKQL